MCCVIECDCARQEDSTAETVVQTDDSVLVVPYPPPPPGHDGGLMVFKLERERPAYAVHQDALYYVKVPC